MSGPYAIGLDIGGGGGRCLVLDTEGGAVTARSCSWRFESAPGTGGLGSDLDLGAIWAGLARLTREALAAAGARPEEIAGVAATSLRLGSVVLDEAGAALLAVPNRDARAVMEGLTLAAEHGEALQARTGRWPYPIYPAARLRWLANQRPDDFERAATLLSISDWVTFALSGERVAEPSQAGETMLFDLASRDWAWDWIDRLELPRRLFPAVRESGVAVAGLTPAAAADLGLLPGTPVSTGGGDSQCALLGAGAVAHGHACLVAGTTAPIQIVVDHPCIDPEVRCWSAQHMIPGRFLVESNAGPMGETLDWWSRLLFPDSPQPVACLLGEVAEASPGAGGMLSTLGAEVMNARQMGMPVGALSLSHMSQPDTENARRDLMRSVVEGMACAVRANLEQARAVAGTDAQPLRVTGGLSRSETWRTILGEVLGEAVVSPSESNATAIGAALCAATGAGRYASLEEAAAAIVRVEPGPEPVADHVARYEGLYGQWRERIAAGAEVDAAAAARITPWVLQAGNTEVTASHVGRSPRILVTADLDADSLAALRTLGPVEVASYREHHRMLRGEALVDAARGFEVFVTEIDLVDADALAALPDLRIVVACRGEAVNVDAAACRAFGIPLLRTPGRNADAVADLTLAFLLMLARKLPAASQFLRDGDGKAGDMARMGKAFAQFRGRELWQKTVGLVGLGAVGRAVAKRVRATGARVLAVDPQLDAEQMARHGAERASLETLLRESDFVSLHAAVTDATRGMIGEAELAAMKHEAFLINTARAALVDQAALVAALERGAIAGAALDTFAVEPPGSDDPLLAIDRVIATPHVGGNTREVAAHQGRIVVEELERLLAGASTRFAVDAEVAEHFRLEQPRRSPGAAELAALVRGRAPAVSDLERDRAKD